MAPDLRPSSDHHGAARAAQTQPRWQLPNATSPGATSELPPTPLAVTRSALELPAFGGCAFAGAVAPGAPPHTTTSGCEAAAESAAAESTASTAAASEQSCFAEPAIAARLGTCADNTLARRELRGAGHARFAGATAAAAASVATARTRIGKPSVPPPPEAASARPRGLSSAASGGRPARPAMTILAPPLARPRRRFLPPPAGVSTTGSHWAVGSMPSPSSSASPTAPCSMQTALRAEVLLLAGLATM
mmetsp:Transcript_118226/g.376880  ORF Transcript_118226/g.376880 Transcript_118226/m.376880 type:complete len:248 (-) Transcript_118226:1297-2040(-)